MAAGRRLRTKGMLDHYKGEDIPSNAGNWLRGRRAVTYLSPKEREDRRLHIQNGRLVDSTGNYFDTRSAKTWDGRLRAIFVMDGEGGIFASTYQKAGEFHHSSLLAGDAVAMAGELGVHDGQLIYISRRSGHYQPGYDLMVEAIDFLKSAGLDFGQAEIDDNLMQ